MPSTSAEANQQYQTGVEQKAKGQFDAALTSFRRAVLADASFFEAQLEIGYLCRDRAKVETMFLRYAFEAFRAAARLNLTHAEAHNQYIMAGQKMQALDSLHEEYSALAKKFPDNELLQKCNKNIVALSMALLPQQTSAGSGHSSGIRKAIMFASLFSLITGVAMILAVPFLIKSGRLEKAHAGRMVKAGLGIGALGIAGFIIRSKID